MSEPREFLRPVFVQEETGPYDQTLGHVEIHDDTGTFAGYDPSPKQILEACEGSGMTDEQLRLVAYATIAFHNKLVAGSLWEAAEDRKRRKLIGKRDPGILAPDVNVYWKMEKTRNFTPDVVDDLRSRQEDRND